MADLDWKQIALAVAAAACLPVVVAMRRRSYRRFIDKFADDEICPHLRGALQLLRDRGHRVVRAGQKSPQFPLEIHVAPLFDPRGLAAELRLGEPVFVSDRNVLCCAEHECELTPVE